MRCKIFIFRHAQSTDNARKIFSGWRDPALTAQGRAQARKIAKQLKKERIDVAFSSSRKRATETLRIALGGRKVPTIVDARQLERSYGNLQGKNKERVAKQLGAAAWRRIHRGYSVVPPGGESVKMVEKRVYAFIKELERFLKAYPCNVAISCHGNSMRPLRKWYQHLSTKQEMALENPQDTDVEIDLDRLAKKASAHDCVTLAHKHIRGGTVCAKHEEKVIASFFPGKRIVRVTLPRKMKPRF